ncbi:MAG: 2-C-methyl-D-erythritol 4-phosphate cytidylyltransferase [Thermodesulfobacteriota bacterium]
MASAIIVAAGSGRRMNAPIPKQYIQLAGLPILTHTLLVFDAHPAISRIVIVVAADDVAFCRDRIVPAADRQYIIEAIAGGAERFDSVYRGLAAVDGGDDVVLIHDGVRPFVTPEMISACIAGAETTGACVPGVPATDTLKRVDGDGGIAETIPRQNVWLAQTPQAFCLDLIRRAYENAIKTRRFVTDDAELVEHLGHRVEMIAGSAGNIKITTPSDIALARALIKINAGA